MGVGREPEAIRERERVAGGDWVEVDIVALVVGEERVTGFRLKVPQLNFKVLKRDMLTSKYLSRCRRAQKPSV